MHDPAYNDHRTRRALDELADMLLTGPVQMPSPFVSHTPDKPAGGNGHANGKPNAGANGSSPLRLHRPSAEARRAPMLEAVMLGHLPGFAGPWVAQYADLAAHAAAGTTGKSGEDRGLALMRLAGSAVELELYGDGAMLNRFERRGARAESLDAALAALAEHVCDFALLIDAPLDAAAREHLIAMDRWTVLTAANDAAVVAAYRLLKSLIVDARIPLPPQGVRLSFAGCDEAAAASAAERIARAGAAFLKTTVKYAGARQKMQPVRRVHVGRFDAGLDAGADGAAADAWNRVLGFFQPPEAPVKLPRPADDGELLTAEELAALAEFDDSPSSRGNPGGGRVSVTPPLKGTPGGAGGGTDECADPETRIDADASVEAEADDPTAMAAAHAIDDELEQRLIRSLQDRRNERPDDDATHDPADTFVNLPTDIDPETPEAMNAAVAPEVAVASPDSLSAYLDNARPLAARCPHHPDVELAVDSAGRLALSLAADADQTSHAIRTLLETRTWAAAHRSLLALTDPAANLNAAADPICHLFTNEPRVALQLAFAGLTDTRPIRLHLLKRITLAGRPHVLHEPLS